MQTTSHSAEDERLANERMVATIAATRVLSLRGLPVRMREVWAGRPVVHVFIRQFGCLFCHEMVASMIDAAPLVEERGGHIVLVGNGTVEQAVRFAEAKGLPRSGVTLVTDPNREAFEAAGMLRSYVQTFLAKDARRAYVRARAEGHQITGVQGDVPQLGGLMVIVPPGRLTYLHRSRFAGDHPRIDDVLPAVGDLRPIGGKRVAG